MEQQRNVTTRTIKPISYTLQKKASKRKGLQGFLIPDATSSHTPYALKTHPLSGTERSASRGRSYESSLDSPLLRRVHDVSQEEALGMFYPPT